jgi:DNA-binding MarR family transcriptional regulator
MNDAASEHTNIHSADRLAGNPGHPLVGAITWKYIYFTKTPPTARLVLLALAYYMGPSEAMPAGLIAQTIQCTTSHVQTALRELLKLGAVKRLTDGRRVQWQLDLEGCKAQLRAISAIAQDAGWGCI